MEVLFSALILDIIEGILPSVAVNFSNSSWFTSIVEVASFSFCSLCFSSVTNGGIGELNFISYPFLTRAFKYFDVHSEGNSRWYFLIPVLISSTVYPFSFKKNLPPSSRCAITLRGCKSYSL